MLLQSCFTSQTSSNRNEETAAFPRLLAAGVGVTCEVSCYDESGHLGVLERVRRSSPPTIASLLSASFSKVILPFGFGRAKNSGRLSFRIQAPCASHP